MIKGRIYYLRSFQTNDVYIGSTIQTLSQRLSKHKSDYKSFLNEQNHYVSSFEIMKYSDCYIELIENVEIESKEELHKIENEYIRKTDCVNKNRAYRTPEEKLEYSKKYRAENVENAKKYYQSNKDELSNKKRIKYICQCGSTCSNGNKARHMKTPLHRNYELKIIN